MIRNLLKVIIVLLFIVPLFTAQPKKAHAQIFTTDKLITVDIGKQTLFAWEGGRIINQTPVSTGLYYTPTVKGVFSIRWKLPQQDMRGNSKWYGPYNLKKVPNVMYFYQDYAIHGAYWHNNFGRKASHGCVNVPVSFSQWLFDWAPAGTKVYIY